jgi:hypothetical protein
VQLGGELLALESLAIGALVDRRPGAVAGLVPDGVAGSPCGVSRIDLGQISP